MRDVEKETRDRLIDAARTHLILSAAGQTGLVEALERLSQQAYGNADRLRRAAEQLRRRFAGAEAISLLEAAAEHAEGPAKPEPPVLSERLDSSDTTPDRWQRRSAESSASTRSSPGSLGGLT